MALFQAPAGSAELLIIVETQARYFSQLNGRFRWVVTVETTATKLSDPTLVLTERYEVPVFLSFQHQDEEDAIMAAVPMIQPRLHRTLEKLLDP